MITSEMIREITKMASRLPAWRFILINFVSLIFAIGYVSGNLPWDKIL